MLLRKKSTLPFNTPYHPNAIEPSPGIDTGETLTEQSHTGPCDINRIVAQSMQSGIFPDGPEPRFGDATGADFQQSMDQIAKTTQSFEQLPAETRAFFNNDVPAFLDYIADPKNIKSLIELGVFKTDKISSSNDDKTELKKPSAPKAENDGDKTDPDPKKDPKKGS